MKTDLKLYAILHPAIDGSKGWICSSKSKAYKLIHNNKHIWKKYLLDIQDFEIIELAVKEDKLQETILEGMPELFL